MRPLLLASLAAAIATAASIGTAVACQPSREPYAAVLGDSHATGDRPMILVGQLPPDAPLALAGPHGDVAFERRERFLRPQVQLDAGAEYQVTLRGGGRDRVLARFTVADVPSADVPSWNGLELIRAGIEPPQTTCEGQAFALTIAVRPFDDHHRPAGFVYVYDRKPRASTPLRGLRGVVPSADGELRLGRLGAGFTFEPQWDRRQPPRTVWLAFGDAAGHVGKPIALAVPRS